MAFEFIGSIIFSFVTSLREVLEAALIIGIITGYLTKLDRKDLHRDVIYGVLGAIGFSIGMAWIFLNLLTGLTEYQKLFEGVVMFLAVGVLTWMIIWMTRQSKNFRSEFQDRIDKIITNKEKAGIVLLVFFSVSREGAELVLFLYASYLGIVEEVGPVISLSTILTGFIIGLAVATVLAFVLFKTTGRLNIKKFFQVTSVILIVFAAGLLAHGLHEIYEFLEIAGSSLVGNFLWTEVWNINNTPLGDLLNIIFGWSYDPSNPNRFEKSAVGGIIVGLFGWNDNPALIEVLAYALYYIIVIYAIKRIQAPIFEEDTVSTSMSH
ncbi:MAG: FTR1 family protein [Candidatus Hodarchaeota archaeon]